MRAVVNASGSVYVDHAMLILLLCCCCLPLFAEEVTSLPDGLKTRLEIEMPERLLGAPMTLHYQISNRGQAPVQLEWLANTRQGGPSSLQVRARHEDGSQALSCLSESTFFAWSGSPGNVDLAPGQTAWISEPLGAFVAMDRPGRWRLRVAHPLGYGAVEQDDDPRWAETEIELGLPSALQAADLIAAHERLLEPPPPPDAETSRALRAERRALGPAWRWLHPREPTACFQALDQPVFLQALRERVSAGCYEAIEGLTWQRDAGAGEVLLRLLESEEPPPPLHQRDGWYPDWRERLLNAVILRCTVEPRWQRCPALTAVAMVFDEPQRTRAIAAALACLLDADEAVRQAAAVLLRGLAPIGDDAGLQAAIRLSFAKDGAAGNLPLLLDAWVRVPDRTSPPDADLTLALALRRRSEDPEAVSIAALRRALEHPSLGMRALALPVIRDEEVEGLLDCVSPLMLSSDAQLCFLVLQVVTRSGHAGFLPDLRRLAIEGRVGVFNLSTLLACEGRSDALLDWCERMERSKDDTSGNLALQECWLNLTGLPLQGHARQDGWRQPTAEVWRNFIAAHAAELDAGKQLQPDSSWPSGLLPPRWVCYLADGSTWPPRP
jgi:hypothetical protein